MARHPAIARLTSTVRRRATARLPIMVRQTTMARHLITIRRYGRRAQFRMPLRRYALRAISSGDVVPGAADGAGSAIRRSLRDLIVAMVRHLVPAITAPIEVGKSPGSLTGGAGGPGFVPVRCIPRVPPTQAKLSPFLIR